MRPIEDPVTSCSQPLDYSSGQGVATQQGCASSGFASGLHSGRASHGAWVGAGSVGSSPCCCARFCLAWGSQASLGFGSRCSSKGASCCRRCVLDHFEPWCACAGTAGLASATSVATQASFFQSLGLDLSSISRSSFDSLDLKTFEYGWPRLTP